MAKTAGRPVPRWVSEAQSKTKFGKLELLLHTSDVMRKSHHPVPRWVSEAMRRLQQEIEMDLNELN